MTENIIHVESINLTDFFTDFFKIFKDQLGNFKYRKKIARMSIEHSISLVIDFEDILSFNEEIANKLLENPKEVLEAASEAIKEVLRIENPEYAKEIERFHARIRGLPESHHVSIRGIRANHIGKLVAVEGIITKISPVKHQLVTAVFKCRECGEEIIIEQREKGLEKPLTCPRCEAEGKKRFEFDLVPEKSKFIDWQKFVLQEKPEELPPGQLPRSIEVIIKEDLVDTIRPGDRAVVTGFLSVVSERTIKKETPPIFKTYLEANYVEVSSKENFDIEITPEDEKRILELSRRSDIRELIINTIAPSIYGYNEIKTAIAALLFGGNSKIYPDGVRVRGDIHILLIGDPGTAKSQMLRYVASIAPRGIYTTGKGSTAAGLTAAVIREKNSGDFFLEAGALVLADGGVACLHPDMRVLVNNRYVRIEDLFEYTRSYKALSNGEIVDIEEKKMNIVALDIEELRVKNAESTIIRRKPWKGRLVRIKFRSGNEIILTPDHLLVDGLTLHWKEAEKFKVGDKVIAPLKIPSVKKKIYILDILPEDWRVKLTNQEKEELKKEVSRKFKSISEFNKYYNISKDFLSGKGSITVGKFRQILKELKIYEEWKRKTFIYGPYSRREKLKTAYITPELAYFIGFVYGDGWIYKKDKKVRIEIAQSKKNKKQIERLHKVFKRFYYGELKEYIRRTNSKIRGKIVSSDNIIIYVNSPLLGFLYEYITKKNFENAFTLDDEALKALIAGVVDSDGCISVKENSKGKVIHVEFLLSNDMKKDTGFAMLLRRFDIYARIIPGKSVNKIQITGRLDVKNLIKNIEKYSVKVKEIPPMKHLVSSSTDKIPLKPVKEISQRIKTNIPTTILLKNGLWSTLYSYSKESVNPNRYQLKKISRKLDKYLDPTTKSEIKNLISRDYFLDEIISIEYFYYDGYVYDLYVPNIHNFTAEGIITHNCIDEFDKMDPRDRVGIHEAMEQQTISIAKAGIVATLNARASILAAANPAFGRYIHNRPVTENIDLPVTILSRFDLIFVITDRPDKEYDTKLAEYVLDFHRGKYPENIEENTIDKELLKKYIAYARRNIHPVLSEEAKSKIVKFYVEMRGKSEEPDSPIAITPRQLEALVRLAEAHAKMALNEIVTEEDAEAAIRLISYFLRSVGVDVETRRIDIDIVMTGKPKSQRDKIMMIMDLIKNMIEENEGNPVKKDDIIQRAVERGLDEGFVRRVIEKMHENGELIEPKPGYILKTIL